MSIERFKRIVTSADELTELLGSPSESGRKKQLAELDGHMEKFVATSPFLLLGTVGSDGRCDVSPRGDMPAVAHVLDSRTLAIPEWKGNRRVDSLRNTSIEVVVKERQLKHIRSARANRGAVIESRRVIETVKEVR